jgi:hypothetical protein
MDLLLSSAIIALAAAGSFLATARLVRPLSRFAATLVATLIVLLMLYYVRELWYSAHLARWLPFSSLIVLGNWLPILGAALAAVAWLHIPGSFGRRTAWASALMLAAGISLAHPFFGSAPLCGNRWDPNGVCIQTTSYTCSPAAAATLLKMHGINANEQEMAELCLTRQGTSWPGLYRGLKLKTANTGWKVEVLEGTIDEICRQKQAGPCILSVGLEANARVDASFSEEYGWQPGVNHSVVLLSSDHRGVEIADPSQPYARERWDYSTLRLLWRGLAIRLVQE